MLSELHNFFRVMLQGLSYPYGDLQSKATQQHRMPCESPWAIEAFHVDCLAEVALVNELTSRIFLTRENPLE